MPFTIFETPTRAISGSRDKDNKITIGRERNFTLDASDVSLTEFDAKAALAVERGVFEGASWPGDTAHVCSNVRITQVGPISYDANATYESLSFDEDNPSGDPDLDRPNIIWSSVSTEVETDVDANGTAITTATGEKYQGVTRLVTDAQVIIKKKYSSFSPYAFYAYENHVNNAVFLSFPAGVLLVKKISPEEIIEKERRYWEVSVEIMARLPLASDVTYEKAWWTRLRHEGYDCFFDYPLGTDPETYEKRKGRARDANGDPVSQPVPLDVDGYRLFKPGTDPPEVDDTQPPNFKYFEHYTPINFALMNLGVS